MTTATIMATWDAAETMLVTVDVVKTDGIHVPVLEPIGVVILTVILALYALVGCIAVHVMTHWLVTWHEERGA